MLRPAILIGCGGSGQKAIRYVRDAVERRLRHAGWQREMPSGWVFLGLDTLNQQEDPADIPLLPQADYHSLSPQYHTYQNLEQAVLARHRPEHVSGDGAGTYSELIGWRPRSSEVKVPLKDGAGANRAVGRFAGILSLRHVLEDPISRAFEAVEQASGDLADVSELLRIPIAPGGEPPTPLVVICASMAGGTGAGVVLDVVEIVRNSHQYGQFPSLVLFTPDIFDEPKYDQQRRSMAGNALGLMCETMNAYWDNEQEAFPLWSGSLNQPGRGPQATFLVGRRSLHGGDLGSAISVYKAVGESLANWVTNASVQERVHHFVTTNWGIKAGDNLGGYQFGKEQQTGVVSSFGAATISIGRDRFERWANDLLAREVLEALVRGHLRAEHRTGADNAQTEQALVEALGKQAAAHIAHGDSTSSLQQPPLLSAEHRGALSVQDAFAHDDEVRSEQRKINAEFHNEFSSENEGTGADWRTWLSRAARSLREQSIGRAQSFDTTQWGTQMVTATCEAVSATVARSSLLVARHAVDLAVELLNARVEELRRDANEQSSRSDNDLNEALSQMQIEKSIRGDSGSVVAAMDGLAKGIARRWFSERLDMAATALEATAHRVFHPAADSLRQAIGSASDALNQPEVEAWPRDESGVPPAYQPSSVELPLESHDSWPGLVAELCKEAKAGRAAALTPVRAARFALIAGDDDIDPLLRPTHDTWSPTQSSVVVYECDADAASIARRVRSWTQRPGSRFERVVQEGLGSYLSERDPVSDTARTDHADRLARFRNALETAKRQSAPLVRIDAPVHGVIYPGRPQTDRPELICAPFPFPDGHPANGLAAQIIGKDYFAVANADVSSVLVSSFLAKPVHPMAVASFTEPVADAVLQSNGDAAEIQAAFWQWRRARRLDQFIPLPRDIRHAMIRGFAAARLCGYVTSDTSLPIRISGEGGPIAFPHPQLTRVQPDDVLAGLLESLALGFGYVSRDKETAFEAYDRLYDLGQSAERLHGDVATWLRDGKTAHEQVDGPRARGSDARQRKAAADEYLNKNITRFKDIKEQPLTGRETETSPRDGRVNDDTPTREIVDESLVCYREVLIALHRIDQAGTV